MMKNKKIRLGLLLLILLVSGGFAYSKKSNNFNKTGAANKEAASDNIEIGLNQELLTDQEEIESTIQTQFSAEAHVADNMLLIEDPYGTAPLTALALFTTEEASQVSIKVIGKSEETAISQAFAAYETTHEIPILGLYADTASKVEFTLTTESGEVTTVTKEIKTEALPDAIAAVDVKQAETSQMELSGSQLTFIAPSTKYAYGFDTNGDIRWYSTRYNSHIFKELENGNLLYLTKESNGASSYNVLLETDYLGKVYHAYEFAEKNSIIESDNGAESTVVHHDAIELPSGNLLLTVNDGTNYVEDTMIEVNRETGRLEKTIDLKTILPEEFYLDYDSTTRKDKKVDWFHQNAVTYDESDDSIIISGRSQDIVMKLDYATSEIKWILASNQEWPEEYQKYLLTLDGTVKLPAGQHAPIILPDQDGDSGTLDILLFDNNVVVTRGDQAASKTYSAATQYRIDGEKQSVSQVWSFGEELGADYFTNIIGSARYIAGNQHRLINYGFLENGKASGVFEVNEAKEIIFEAKLSDFPVSAWSYRAERFSLYNANWKLRLGK